MNELRNIGAFSLCFLIFAFVCEDDRQVAERSALIEQEQAHWANGTKSDALKAILIDLEQQQKVASTLDNE